MCLIFFLHHWHKHRIFKLQITWNIFSFELEWTLIIEKNHTIILINKWQIKEPSYFYYAILFFFIKSHFYLLKVLYLLLYILNVFFYLLKQTVQSWTKTTRENKYKCILCLSEYYYFTFFFLPNVCNTFILVKSHKQLCDHDLELTEARVVIVLK